MKFIFLFVLMFSVSAQALTLKQFINSFQKNSPKLLQLKAEVKNAEQDYKLAWSPLYPQLSLNASYVDRSSPAANLGFPLPPGITEIETTDYTATLNVDQVIYAGGKIINNIKLQRSKAAISNLSYQAQAQFLTKNALLSVVRWKFMQESITVLNESLALQKRFLGLVNKRVKRGLARSFEYDQAFSEKMAYELRIQQMEQQKNSLLQSLMTITDLSEVELKNLVLPSAESLQVNMKGAGGANNNWDYRSVVAEEKIIDEQLALEMSDERPSITLGGSIGRQGPEFKSLRKDEFRTSQVYVNVKIPLFSGFSSFKKRAKSKTKKYSLEKKKNDIARNVKVDSKQILDRLTKNKELLKKNLLWKKTAKRGLGKALSSYNRGQVESVQVVQMQAVYERASVAYIDLFELYFSDFITWNFIQGRKIESIF